MRRAAKIDANHRDIVRALRGVGCSVQSLASVGKGCPDILCGRAGENFLLEVKTDKTIKHGLNGDQFEWVQKWGGQVVVVSTVDEALKAVRVRQ